MKTGDLVIVRTYGAGVHVGRLVDQDGQEVTLSECRRLWRWRGANTLNEISLRGVSIENHTRLSEPVASITLTSAIEIIPVMPNAVSNLTTSRWL